MKRTVSFAIGALCLATSGARAQRAADLAPGTRVRVALADSLRQEVFLPRSRTLIGAVSRATADTLWLHVGGPDTVRIPRADVRTLDVSRGASRAGSAVEQGLFVAIAFGLPLYSAADDRDERREAIAIVGGTAVVASIIGALRPYERWRRAR
jgi:hypothetical protein